MDEDRAGLSFVAMFVGDTYVQIVQQWTSVGADDDDEVASHPNLWSK